MASRVPGDFFAEDGLAVLDGGNFAVAGAEVEANPAAVPMRAQWRSAIAGWRQLLDSARNDFKGALIDFRAHDFCVEPARGCVAKVALQLVSEFGRAGKVD